MIPRQTTRCAQVIALCALALSACSGSPKTTFHTLGMAAQPNAGAPKRACRVKSLGVGSITLPALLERSEVVLRTDDYTVEVSPSHEWGGRLADQLMRALARYLQLRLPQVRVMVVPWEVVQAPEVQLTLSVDQFDGSVGGTAVLRGTWILQDPQDGRPIVRKQVSLEQKVNGNNVRAVVEAQAKLVTQLGEQVVRGLR